MKSGAGLWRGTQRDRRKGCAAIPLLDFNDGRHHHYAHPGGKDLNMTTQTSLARRFLPRGLFDRILRKPFDIA